VEISDFRLNLGHRLPLQFRDQADDGRASRDGKARYSAACSWCLFDHPAVSWFTPEDLLLVLDLGVKLHQSVQDGFRSWRAARDVDVDRQNGVDALDGA